MFRLSYGSTRRLFFSVTAAAQAVRMGAVSPCLSPTARLFRSVVQTVKRQMLNETDHYFSFEKFMIEYCNTDFIVPVFIFISLVSHVLAYAAPHPKAGATNIYCL